MFVKLRWELYVSDGNKNYLVHCFSKKTIQISKISKLHEISHTNLKTSLTDNPHTSLNFQSLSIKGKVKNLNKFYSQFLLKCKIHSGKCRSSTPRLMNRLGTGNTGGNLKKPACQRLSIVEKLETRPSMKKTACFESERHLVRSLSIFLSLHFALRSLI